MRNDYFYKMKREWGVSATVKQAGTHTHSFATGNVSKNYTEYSMTVVRVPINYALDMVANTRIKEASVLILLQHGTYVPSMDDRIVIDSNEYVITDIQIYKNNIYALAVEDAR